MVLRAPLDRRFVVVVRCGRMEMGVRAIRLGCKTGWNEGFKIDECANSWDERRVMRQVAGVDLGLTTAASLTRNWRKFGYDMK